MDNDNIDKKVNDSHMNWQKVTWYVEQEIKPESRYELKIFEDEMLIKIWFDWLLNHVSESPGCCVDATPDKLAPNGKNAKKQSQEDDLNDKDEESN